MPNKDRNKRSVRKARAEERARVEAASASAEVAKPAQKRKAPAKRPKFSLSLPRPLKAIADYFRAVRSETRRVVWPTGKEVRSYALIVVATLLLFGVVLFLIDSGIVAGLVGFTGLRGLING